MSEERKFKIISIPDEITLNKNNIYEFEIIPSDEFLTKEEYEGIPIRLVSLQKVEQLEKENKRLNNIINKARRKLGEYKHYSTPTEEQNKENEDMSEEVYQILHENLYEIKEYVRTKKGEIFDYNEVYKKSNNIIDLIEEGDYVNGHRVLNVLDFNDNSKMVSLEKIYDSNITNEDIKSILTKEQFSSMEYKIGE